MGYNILGDFLSMLTPVFAFNGSFISNSDFDF